MSENPTSVPSLKKNISIFLVIFALFFIIIWYYSRNKIIFITKKKGKKIEQVTCPLCKSINYLIDVGLSHESFAPNNNSAPWSLQSRGKGKRDIRTI